MLMRASCKTSPVKRVYSAAVIIQITASSTLYPSISAAADSLKVPGQNAKRKDLDCDMRVKKPPQALHLVLYTICQSCCGHQLHSFHCSAAWQTGQTWQTRTQESLV